MCCAREQPLLAAATVIEREQRRTRLTPVVQAVRMAAQPAGVPDDVSTAQLREGRSWRR